MWTLYIFAAKTLAVRFHARPHAHCTEAPPTACREPSVGSRDRRPPPAKPMSCPGGRSRQPSLWVTHRFRTFAHLDPLHFSPCWPPQAIGHDGSGAAGDCMLPVFSFRLSAEGQEPTKVGDTHRHNTHTHTHTRRQSFSVA